MRRYAPYILVGMFLAIAVTAHLSGVTEVFSPDAIIAKRQAFQDLVATHPILAPLVFFSVYLAVAALALPVAAILSLLGGFLFGVWLGAALVLVSATAGALIVFFLARSAIGEPLRRKAGPLYEKVATNMRENAFGYLLFLRLVPLFPFFLVNLVAALFDMTARKFLLATFIGMAPATIIYVNFGRQIGTVASARDLLSPSVLMALTGFGVLALAPIIYKQWAKKKTDPTASPEDF
jgi:uncharacterized membrane protein YdjX (TVP38/TMEM64 family)